MIIMMAAHNGTGSTHDIWYIKGSVKCDRYIINIKVTIWLWKYCTQNMQKQSLQHLQKTKDSKTINHVNCMPFV